MTITIKIEYDNWDQVLDTSGLPKYLVKHIKNAGKERININIEHGARPMASIPAVITKYGESQKNLKGIPLV